MKVLWLSGFGKVVLVEMRGEEGIRWEDLRATSWNGERVFYYIVGLVTHSRNWQREGATRGRSSSTLGELCDPLSPQLCAIVLI